DALKRVAVRVGVGRYLYSLPSQWCDYDPQRKCFTRTPQLPAWALPKKAAAASPQPAAEPSQLARQLTARLAAALTLEEVHSVAQMGKAKADGLTEPEKAALRGCYDAALRRVQPKGDAYEGKDDAA